MKFNRKIDRLGLQSHRIMLGFRVVIGAGYVVTKDFDAFSIAFGESARIVGTIPTP